MIGKYFNYVLPFVPNESSFHSTAKSKKPLRKTKRGKDMMRELKPFKASTIEYKGRRFILGEPITCSVFKDRDGFVFFMYEPLGVRVGSCSHTIIDFSEEFAMLWDGYAMADDKDLADDAKVLKQRLLKLVKEVRGK